MRNPKEKENENLIAKTNNESFAEKNEILFIEKCCDEQKSPLIRPLMSYLVFCIVNK